MNWRHNTSADRARRHRAGSRGERVSAVPDDALIVATAQARGCDLHEHHRTAALPKTRLRLARDREIHKLADADAAGL